MVVNSHPRLHIRQAAGQRGAIVGSLNCSVGLNTSDRPARFAGSLLTRRVATKAMSWRCLTEVGEKDRLNRKLWENDFRPFTAFVETQEVIYEQEL